MEKALNDLFRGKPSKIPTAVQTADRKIGDFHGKESGRRRLPIN
jgi:hypothetical protein